MNKLIIDEKVCIKHKMTLTEVLYALAVRQTKGDEIDNMINREILILNEEGYQVTQHWSEVLDEILAESSGNCSKSDEELLELSKKLREVYPEGKMRDRYGKVTPYYFRCNNKEVKDKLKIFFTLYNNYTDEEIIDATKRYVASFNGDYSGMRLLKYFIIKNDVKPGEEGNHVEQISDLLTFLENKESAEEVEGTNDDWTTQLV